MNPRRPTRLTVPVPVLILTLAAAASLSGCERKSAAALLGSGDPAHAPSGYLTPPKVTSVSGPVAGMLNISGVGAPETRIRGVTPDRRGYGATSDKAGRFTLEAPPVATPLLIAVSEEQDGGRQLSADGWLFVPPDAPSHAVVLRAGAPSRPLPGGGGLIASTDFDAGGGGAVSGVTTPGAEVDITVDGGPVTRTHADTQGIYAAHLGADKPLSSGAHTLRVTVGGQTIERGLIFNAASTTQTFNAVHEADGWRVAWTTPGGGVQTTFIITKVQGS
jgi:hypothetical protein